MILDKADEVYEINGSEIGTVHTPRGWINLQNLVLFYLFRAWINQLAFKFPYIRQGKFLLKYRHDWQNARSGYKNPRQI
jgi:hypothetical protein